MTNFEKFKSEILEAASKANRIALKNNKPVPCNTATSCKECDLDCPSCYLDLYKWLYEEYTIRKIDLPENIKVDTPIWVSDDGEHWRKRYFAYFENDKVYAWNCGTTSWSSDGQNDTVYWRYAKLPDDKEA